MILVIFVRADRQSSTGGFITLQGMMSGIVTLPVALPLEFLGRKINYRSNWEMGTAILFCGALLFGLSFGALKLVEYLWNSTPAHT